MTLDDEALREAQSARDRLLELQHSAEVARVDYHHAIRRLHAAGGSLREIAEALGLSHQRVHQVVEPMDAGPGGGGRPHGRAGFGPMHRVSRRLRAFTGFERFTAEARETVAAAVDASAGLGHRRVGTEHLVVAVAGAPAESVAARALASLGVTGERVVAEVRARLGSVPGGAQTRRPFTPAARRVLQRALSIAAERGDGEVGAHHILLGIVEDGRDGAALLAALGADADAVRAAVAAAVPAR